MTYPDLALHIDGAWIAEGRQTRAVIEPATERELGRLPVATEPTLTRP
jgi:succinate-semialdehyde dehydrogenase/glutarate-semialdehyde dehydrogenase